tara:strand:- start:2562 stop:3497 length:936 start_codon:yes stop_codon:yes gene_type:complete
MTEKLLIVGGTGFIGKNLAQKAVDNGFTTTVVSLNMPKQVYQVSGVKYFQANITNLDQLKEIFLNKKFDYVINLSGYVDHSSFLGGGINVINTHFSGVINLLQALDWIQIKRFVQIGSSDEYGSLPSPQHEEMSESPISSYSLGKVASTKLLQMLYRTEKFPVVILRLFLVYGEGQNNERFLPQIINGCLMDKKFPTSKGEQLRDFSHIDDITNGILMSLVKDGVNGEIINIASGVPESIREIIGTIQKLIGTGRPDFGKIDYRDGENMSLIADITKAKKLLGWNPKIGINEGLKRTVNHFRLNNNGFRKK